MECLLPPRPLHHRSLRGRLGYRVFDIGGGCDLQTCSLGQQAHSDWLPLPMGVQRNLSFEAFPIDIVPPYTTVYRGHYIFNIKRTGNLFYVPAIKWSYLSVVVFFSNKQLDNL